MIKILVLGYSKKETSLIDFLKSKKKINVTNYNKKVTKNFIEKFNLVICFGYKHIIDQSIIKTTKVPLINLHIGYLPYNRGSHPNFWSFVENTPSGVTIHLIDEGIDSGDIIIQKKFDIENKDNFNSIVKKNYDFASIAIIEALKILENDKFKIIPNDDKLATYNTTPSLIEAIRYRLRIIKKIIINKN